MKRKYTAQISALLMSAAITSASCPASSYVHAADMLERGTIGKYMYEFWNQSYAGEVEFTPEADGTLNFKAADIENTVMLKGLEFEPEYSYGDFGKITVNYSYDYSAAEDDNTFFGLYGWMQQPKAEYYIIEGWGSYKPPGDKNILETVEIDGALYDIIVTYRAGQTGIIGTEGHQEYWSVRRENKLTTGTPQKNINGTITLSEHFKVWEKYGLKPDSKLRSIYTNAEGYRSKELNITLNEFEIITEYGDELFTEVPAETTAPAVTEPVIPEAPSPDVTEPVIPEAPTPDVTEPVIPETPSPDATEPVIPEAPSPDVTEPEIVPGDADGNGSINSADLIAIEKKLLYPDDNTYDIAQCDLNEDKKVNIVDFIMLKSLIISDGK